MLLKWVFHSYRHPRVIQWQGAVSDATETARGIVAERGAAPAMLRAVLIRTLDEFCALRVTGLQGLCRRHRVSLCST